GTNASSGRKQGQSVHQKVPAAKDSSPGRSRTLAHADIRTAPRSRYLQQQHAGPNSAPKLRSHGRPRFPTNPVSSKRTTDRPSTSRSAVSSGSSGSNSPSRNHQH